jgi:phosphatidylglycerol:prolipoprotein diacylglycerol transferase
MRPIIFDFGTITIGGVTLTPRVYGYGLMLVTGFLLALWIAQRRARRCGENPEHVSRMGILALVGGVLGARLAYVIEHAGEFFDPDGTPRIGEMLNITSGGLIYYGGVALATVAVLIYLFIQRLPARRFLDIIAASLMVGLAFGRAGCLLNGCCYGARCEADWWLAQRFPMYAKPLIKLGDGNSPYSGGTHGPTPPYSHQMHQGQLRPDPRLVRTEADHWRLVPPGDFDAEQARIAAHSHSLPVKPAQALGLINALLLAALLTGMFRLRTREGQVFATLVVLYPITRFALESVRADNEHDLSRLVLTHNQVTSVVLVAAGLAMHAWLLRRPPSAGPTAAERAAASDAASKAGTA